MTVDGIIKPNARVRTKSGPTTPRKTARNILQTPDSKVQRTPQTPDYPPRSPSVLRVSTPSQGLKIRAALTTDAKLKKKSTTLLASSTRSRADSPLPSTPTKPVARLLFPPTVDPEAGLVDWTNVEDEGDVSMERDDSKLLLDAGAEDKVLVSIRVKPASEDEASAWEPDVSQGTVKLCSSFVKSGATNGEFRFDNVLGGSENKTVYNATAKSHVRAAMEGYNAVIFAYGQTASGKTFTLTGDDDEPGIIPRAMRDVFRHIRQTPSREYLLRASYLEIYNEQIHDLLSTGATGSLTLQDSGVVVGLREEVVMSVKNIKEVLERGESNRRTASTDWNSRSSRSHSVFRLIIESREVAPEMEQSPAPGAVPSTPGGSRLQARGGRSVRFSTLSLIDLAGSEKATSDKDRTREGKYINTSLLTLGTVISTLAENAAKKKKDFVPFRNSKLTKLLQPSLSGNARISVICTLNPTSGSIPESTSTLQFASRVKKVALNAAKKEIVDTDALIERYRKEIEELKARLNEKEQEVQAPLKRRLSAKERKVENRAMDDLNTRINQLKKLILTSETVQDGHGDESRPVSPCKLDFDLTPFELHEELLAAKRTIESQATQILSLEASLQARPLIPYDAPDDQKDKLIAELQKTVKESEIVIAGYEDNLGAPLRAVKEDVEREWQPKVDELEAKLAQKTDYAEELERALEKLKQMQVRHEQERMALFSFVREVDGHFASKPKPTSSIPVLSSSFKPTLASLSEVAQPSMPHPSPVAQLQLPQKFDPPAASSPKRMTKTRQSLLDIKEEELGTHADLSFGDSFVFDSPRKDVSLNRSTSRIVLGDKENIPL